MFEPKDIWHTSSPDLNACDLWLFIVEKKNNSLMQPLTLPSGFLKPPIDESSGISTLEN